MTARWWCLLAGCTLPGLVFALSLLLEHRAYFWDGTVYRCAIEATLANDNPYNFIGDCAGYFLPHTYPYAGTRLLAELASLIGRDTLTFLYALGYIGGVALFAQVAIRLGKSLWLPAALLIASGAGVFVSELVSGNVGIPFYGLLFWLLWRDSTRARASAALCVAMAPFKPLYSAYLLTPFLLNRNLLIPAAGMAVVAAWYVSDALMFSAQFAEWLRTAVHHANEVPGFGFTMLVRKTGLELSGQTGIAVIYLIWAAAILVLTMRAIARAPTPLVQALVAVAGIALMLPRLKEYDCLVLLPLTLAIWPNLKRTEQREWLMLVGGFGIVLPAAIWWLRKLMLLWSGTPPDWRAFVDMRWLVQNQGSFLLGAMLAALFWLACRPSSEDGNGHSSRSTFARHYPQILHRFATLCGRERRRIIG